MKKKHKTVLITGATSGIGLATAKELAKQGYCLILVSRSKKKLQQVQEDIVSKSGNKDITIYPCDLSSQKEIRRVAADIKKRFSVIDVLINNAAVHMSKFDLTEEGVGRTFAVNHLASFLLTGLLLDQVKASNAGRIINVSSDCHTRIAFRIDGTVGSRYKGKYPSYCMSKLANVMFTIDLAERLKLHGVTVNSLHPGLVRTNIGMDNPDLLRRLSNTYKRYFAISSEEGSDTITYLATSSQVKDITGEYFVNRKVCKVARAAMDPNKRDMLWEVSEKLTGFKYYS